MSEYLQQDIQLLSLSTHFQKHDDVNWIDAILRLRLRMTECVTLDTSLPVCLSWIACLTFCNLLITEYATAMRKLIRIGFETYVGNLYKDGKITLREAARFLNLNVPDTLDRFIHMGIKGNVEAADILKSLSMVAAKQKKLK